MLGAFRDLDDVWLTGGAALGGFHTHHRRSKDLDWFTANAGRLDELCTRLEQWCIQESAAYETLQHYPGFRRYRVRTADEQILVDLVHEPAAQVVPPTEKPLIDGVHVDPIVEIRANKLAAMLGRAETKDLIDLYAIERAGLDPLEGLEDAARKDGGLDPATLAWVLSSFPIDLEGLLLDEPIETATLEEFRNRLVEELQIMAWPKD